MSAYSDWKCGALTDEEFAYYMRQECEDRSEHIKETYTDDPDDPYYICENCKHCISVEVFKPIIRRVTWVDDKGYVHNSPETQKLIAVWGTDYTPANICDKLKRQVYDDDFCNDFEEA